MKALGFFKNVSPFFKADLKHINLQIRKIRFMLIYIYIYIYIEREREVEKKTDRQSDR